MDSNIAAQLVRSTFTGTGANYGYLQVSVRY